MSLSLTTPVTGSAQSGLTSPTYTLAVDTPPTSAGKQYAVTALGGTQTGVDTASSPSRPFTITGSRPQVLRSLGPVDPVTGVLRAIPRNSYTAFRVRKGVTPLAGQSPVVAQATVTIDIPAGAELADAPNVRAMLSLLFGAVAQASSSIGDTVVTGVI
ncbi:coat protein [ssRNA phage Gerhypos.4_10]|uniref:Coat protein n=2 Tax=Norzivirales TaxID=2842247 RepID=A0A8S5L3C4_9VIRU|nr:coat protein [ssRNA phage Gerhypos.4_10]QDH89642.1 MAG: hypothetical protein H2Bulk351293_000003 [Leviviridae sp.]QDH90228.1 MAG: hypothetical protein H4Bulk46337_000003 [Leviviridae sp.]DAD51674.1 TPA_asm: coat protein [ssRNA phage Gerhypos.4_10]